MRDIPPLAAPGISRQLSTVCSATPGSPFDPSLPVSHAVANVISSIAFGDRFDYQDQTFLSLLDVIQSLFLELTSPWTQVGDACWGHGGSVQPRSGPGVAASERILGRRAGRELGIQAGFYNVFRCPKMHLSTLGTQPPSVTWEPVCIFVDLALHP